MTNPERGKDLCEMNETMPLADLSAYGLALPLASRWRSRFKDLNRAS